MVIACLLRANMLWQVSGVQWSQLQELVVGGEISSARGGTPRTLSAVHDINVCSARPYGQLQLYQTKYEVGAVHPAGINEAGGIIGQTRMFAVLVEWELIFYEILLIQNN